MQGLLDGSRIAVFHDAKGALAAPTAATTVAVYVRDEQVWSEGHAEWLGAWRQSFKSDPHAPLLPLQPLSSQVQPA